MGELNIQGMILTVKDEMAVFELKADLGVRDNERVAICGRSGSGKSTFLKWVGGLLLDHEIESKGRMTLDQKDITFVPAHKRNIGFVFQEHALFSHLNVLDNVGFGLKMRGFSKSERDKRSLKWLERIGLRDKRDAKIYLLSGGEKQRVALARAFVFQPSLILLDEPFSALDLELKSKLKQEIIKLHREWPVPMVFVSHDPTDIQEFATRSYKIEESSDQRSRVLTEFKASSQSA